MVTVFDLTTGRKVHEIFAWLNFVAMTFVGVKRLIDTKNNRTGTKVSRR